MCLFIHVLKDILGTQAIHNIYVMNVLNSLGNEDD